MQLTLAVHMTTGDTYQVKTNLYTIVALERKFKIRATDLEHGIAMEHLAYLAYEASKQHEIVVPVAFDDFIKKLEAVEVVEADDANPTPAAP